MTYLRLGIFILFSVILHVFIVGSMPGLDFNLKSIKRTVEIELVPPSVRELPPAPKNKAGMSAVKNSIADETPQPSISVPDIDIPDFGDIEELDVKVPDLELAKRENNSNLEADDELLKELKSSSDNFQEKNRLGDGVESDVTGDSDSRDFFVINNLNRNRKLADVPERPKFSLSADTTVNVGFKIDREGNTYSIILLSRTDSNIERLAIDFVKKLKFNAVLADKPEQAEIILYFRVR